MTSSDTKAGGLRPTRRTVVKGAAWAVPAVMVAAPAAMAQASQPVVVTFEGNFCKHPGNFIPGDPNSKVYHATFCFNNTSGLTINVSLTSTTVNGVDGEAYFDLENQIQTITLDPNEHVCIDVDLCCFGDSANGSATLYFAWQTVDADPPQSGNGSVGASGNDLPPCSNIGEPANAGHGKECHTPTLGPEVGAVVTCTV